MRLTCERLESRDVPSVDVFKLSWGWGGNWSLTVQNSSYFDGGELVRHSPDIDVRPQDVNWDHGGPIGGVTIRV